MWRRLIADLGVRGRGVRESGAFLLGRRRGGRPVISHVVYFDDLEPGSLNSAVHLTTRAYSSLWAYCSDHQVEVLADVHTHPGTMVCQSGIDQDNPLIAQSGHIAVIVPRFAAGNVTLDQVGVHEYRGDDGWLERPGALTHRRFL